MFINNNVSFGMVFFCKCVREFGKVWAFARAEFGMEGTGICPSPIIIIVTVKYHVAQLLCFKATIIKLS